MQCTATSKQSGEQCKRHAVTGSTKCKFHGGASLVGIASPSFKTGRYSKDLPTRLAARYAEAISDASLLELRDEIGLMGVRLGELLGRVDTGESTQRWQTLQIAYVNLQDAARRTDPLAFRVALNALGSAIEAGSQDYHTWREIMELIEQRRKLVDSEHKRLVAMSQMITAEQAMVLLSVVTDTVRKHVSDPAALAAIASDFRSIITIDAGG
jgi:ADP-ribose pyrophosphatase YjhB (NUDIX family)